MKSSRSEEKRAVMTACAAYRLSTQQEAEVAGQCHCSSICSFVLYVKNLNKSLSACDKIICTHLQGVFLHFDNLSNFNFIEGRASMIGMRRKFL